MACKEVQKTMEYYQWLIQLERQEFEEELLDFVSVLLFFFFKFWCIINS